MKPKVTYRSTDGYYRITPSGTWTSPREPAIMNYKHRRFVAFSEYFLGSVPVDEVFELKEVRGEIP